MQRPCRNPLLTLNGSDILFPIFTLDSIYRYIGSEQL